MRDKITPKTRHPRLEKPATKEKKAISVVCIAGMHRSGTSMVAHLLNLCGLYLGEEKDLNPAAADNPEGYWENFFFLTINEHILSALGGSWDVPPMLKQGWEKGLILEPFRKDAETLIHSMHNNSPWGWKDPRTSLTLPFWQQLIPELKIIVCLRHPHGVARSLFHRGYSSRRFSARLWYVYYRQLLASVSKSNKIITHYDSYFFDAESEIRRLLSFLEMPQDINQIREATRIVNNGLRHTRSDIEDLSEFEAYPEVRRLYSSLSAQAGLVFDAFLSQPVKRDDKEEVCRPGVFFNAQSEEKNEFSETYQIQIIDLENSVNMLAARIAKKEILSQTLLAQVAEKEQAVQALTSQAAVREQAIKTLITQAAENEQVVRSLSTQVADREHQMDQLSAHLEDLKNAHERQIGEHEESIRRWQYKFESLFLKKQQQDTDLQSIHEELTGIRSGASWTIFQWIRKARLFFIPAGGRRERIWWKAKKAIGILRHEGPAKLWNMLMEKIQSPTPAPSRQIGNLLQKTKPGEGTNTIQGIAGAKGEENAPQDSHPPGESLWKEPQAPLESVIQGQDTSPQEIRAFSPEPDSQEILLSKIVGAMRFPVYSLSISHDDFLTITAGVQTYIRNEARAFSSREISHVHFSPAKSIGGLSDARDELLLQVNVDMIPIGFGRARDLQQVFRSLQEKGSFCAAVEIHHLLNWDLDALSSLLQTARPVRKYLWLHDFYSVCVNYTLLRNDKEYCNLPDNRSNSCMICKYGEFRPLHQHRMQGFRDRFDFQILAPSQSTKMIAMKETSGIKDDIRIVPYFNFKSSEIRIQRRDGQLKTVKIGFIGRSTAAKGWGIWREIVDAFHDRPEYEFHHFGQITDECAGKEYPEKFESVFSTPTRPFAMIEALERIRIDAIIFCPNCQETFSILAYEAASAGCYIFTCEGSGNVADFVKQSGHGRVFANTQDLYSFFHNPVQIQETIELFRKQYEFKYALEFNSEIVDEISSTHSSALDEKNT